MWRQFCFNIDFVHCLLAKQPCNSIDYLRLNLHEFMACRLKWSVFSITGIAVNSFDTLADIYYYTYIWPIPSIDPSLISAAAAAVKLVWPLLVVFLHRKQPISISFFPSLNTPQHSRVSKCRCRASSSSSSHSLPSVFQQWLKSLITANFSLFPKAQYTDAHTHTESTTYVQYVYVRT